MNNCYISLDAIATIRITQHTLNKLLIQKRNAM